MLIRRHKINPRLLSQIIGLFFRSFRAIFSSCSDNFLFDSIRYSGLGIPVNNKHKSTSREYSVASHTVPSLAACVGADRLQDCCAHVQSSSWRRAAVSGAAHLCRRPSQSPGSAVGCHQSLGCAIRQTVNQSINQSVNFYSGLSDRSHFEDH